MQHFLLEDNSRRNVFKFPQKINLKIQFFSFWKFKGVLERECFSFSVDFSWEILLFNAMIFPNNFPHLCLF